MSKIRLSDGIVKDDVLVIGLASNPKGGIAIEGGDLSLDAKALLALLSDMGATGKVDEIVKIPSSFVRVLVFTGLGTKSMPIATKLFVAQQVRHRVHSMEQRVQLSHYQLLTTNHLQQLPKALPLVRMPLQNFAVHQRVIRRPLFHI